MSTTFALIPFSSRPFNENSNFSKTVHTIVIKFSSHSTPKGAPACAKSYVWDLRNSQNWSQNNQMTMKYVIGKSAPSFFRFFGCGFMISETSSRLMKMCAMLYRLKSYSRVFFTIRSAGAFRSLQKLIGTKQCIVVY